MWVNTESFYDGRPSKMNLGVAMNVDDLGDHFRVYFAGESGFQAVRKTPEMIEAYNSLVPEKSQPVVPDDDPSAWGAVAVQDSPFRITGLGWYETASGQRVQIDSNDGTDPVDNAPWHSPQHGWYKTDGTSLTFNSAKRIVKLIKLDEVQP